MQIMCLRSTLVAWMLFSVLAASQGTDGQVEQSTFEDVTSTAFVGGPPEYDRPHGEMADLVSDVTVMASGGAVGDFDNDGDEDIFYLSGGSVPDRLYINDGLGTFTDDAENRGVAVAHVGVGVAVCDFDGDGWLDLFVTSFGDGSDPDHTEHKLYRNTGGGNFEDVAAAWNIAQDDIPNGWSPAFGDYDLDGDLDLCVAQRDCCGLVDFGAARLLESIFDELLQHNIFVDVTDSEAPEFNDLKQMGFAPRFIDMDGPSDGEMRPDLLLTVDFGEAQIMVNTVPFSVLQPTFEALPYSCWHDPTFDYPMGQTVGDFNADGRMDWYYTTTPAFMGGPNRLLEQQVPSSPLCDMEFLETSELRGVGDGDWGWGTAAVDVDNDGDTDIVETNGYGAWIQPSYLFVNNGPLAPSFTRQYFDPDFEYGSEGEQGRGILSFDMDGDGDQDVLIFHNDSSGDHPGAGQPVLWKNRTIEDSEGDVNYLRLFIDTCELDYLPSNGVGVRVEADVSFSVAPLVRYIDAGSNYLSQGELSAHFGLRGDSATDLTVYWTNGSVTALTAIGANQTLRLGRADLNGDGTVDALDIGIFDLDLLPNSDFDGDGDVDLDDEVLFLDAYQACGGV